MAMQDDTIKVLLFLAQGFEDLEAVAILDVAFLLMECLMGPKTTQEVRHYMIYR
jgi:hypothetical protein